MPNHVKTVIKMEGTTEQIKKVFEQHVVEKDGVKRFDFETIERIEMADIIAKIDMKRLEIKSYITDHFAIEEREVREPDGQIDEEEWQVKIGCSFVSIEVTTKGSATMRDNGNDIYHSLGGSKKYYWRWL